jgi:rhodanese-related sulfurtransferase
MDQFIEFAKNHWFLWLALLAILAVIAFEETRRNIKGIRRIAPQQAVDLINHEDAIVFDLRDQHAFNAGHILNAIHVVPSDFEGMLKKIEQHKGKSIILAGRDEAQVVTVGAKLQKHGFSKLYTISGGLAAWKNASFPLVKK